MKVYKHKRVGGRKGKMRLEHHLVWEDHNGTIPEGYEIHHIDGNPVNNHILNLDCLRREDHLRMHSPCFFKIEGEWRSYCRYCKSIITEANKLARKHNKCKECHRKQAVIYRDSKIFNKS